MIARFSKHGRNRIPRQEVEATLNALDFKELRTTQQIAINLAAGDRTVAQRLHSLERDGLVELELVPWKASRTTYRSLWRRLR